MASKKAGAMILIMAAFDSGTSTSSQHLAINPRLRMRALRISKGKQPPFGSAVIVSETEPSTLVRNTGRRKDNGRGFKPPAASPHRHRPASAGRHGGKVSQFPFRAAASAAASSLTIGWRPTRCAYEISYTTIRAPPTVLAWAPA
jgi:hypothetical protein